MFFLVFFGGSVSVFPLLSSNRSRSCLPVVTADERIIKPRGVLTERSHAVQAAIHATTVCVFIVYCGLRTILY